MRAITVVSVAGGERRGRDRVVFLHRRTDGDGLSLALVSLVTNVTDRSAAIVLEARGRRRRRATRRSVCQFYGRRYRARRSGRFGSVRVACRTRAGRGPGRARVLIDGPTARSGAAQLRTPTSSSLLLRLPPLPPLSLSVCVCDAMPASAANTASVRATVVPSSTLHERAYFVKRFIRSVDCVNVNSGGYRYDSTSSRPRCDYFYGRTGSVLLHCGLNK